MLSCSLIEGCSDVGLEENEMNQSKQITWLSKLLETSQRITSNLDYEPFHSSSEKKSLPHQATAQSLF